MYTKTTTIVEQFGKPHKKKYKHKEHDEDVVVLDVPLLIRLLEYAREEAKGDAVLHSIAQHLVEMSKEEDVLTMDHYKHLLEEVSEHETK